jgi:hypothetical protein
MRLFNAQAYVERYFKDGKWVWESDPVPEHSAQEMRIIRSGLKPEPGAWERSLVRLWEHEWKQDTSISECERLAVVRRQHALA